MGNLELESSFLDIVVVRYQSLKALNESTVAYKGTPGLFGFILEFMLQNVTCKGFYALGIHTETVMINTLRSRQNGRYFAGSLFWLMFLYENFRISNRKCAPNCPINNFPTLIRTMAWCRPGARQYLNQWWLDHRRKYSSLGISELKWPLTLIHAGIKVNQHW